MVSSYLIRPLRSLCEALKPGLVVPRRRPDLAEAEPSGERPVERGRGGGAAQATARPEAAAQPADAHLAR